MEMERGKIDQTLHHIQTACLDAQLFREIQLRLHNNTHTLHKILNFKYKYYIETWRIVGVT